MLIVTAYAVVVGVRMNVAFVVKTVPVKSEVSHKVNVIVWVM